MCQKKRTRRASLPTNLEPKTTSAFSSRIGPRSFAYSRGSYSRSASWTMT